MLPIAIDHIDQIRINFDSDKLWIVNIALALVMFGVALDIRTSDFKALLRNPKPIIIGIILQFFIIPLVTYLIVIGIKPYPSVALGLFMVAACPGGNISNFLTKLSGGNSALSVSLTAFATVAALIMTPLNFALWSSFYEPTAKILREISLDPAEVAELIVLILAIPLFLGMAINHYAHNFSQKLNKYLKPISIGIFATFIILAFANNVDIFLEHIHYVFWLVIFHNIVLLLTGYSVARLTGMDAQNRKTLSFETGIQNAGLGLMLVFSFFSHFGGMAIFVAFWAIWDMLSGLILALIWSYLTKKVYV